MVIWAIAEETSLLVYSAIHMECATNHHQCLVERRGTYKIVMHQFVQLYFHLFSESWRDDTDIDSIQDYKINYIMIKKSTTVLII